MDCDAFYASVEKRDNPDLADRPVIVGGGRRGVVAACCYVARIYGVRSAMPMFKALELCPEAVVIPPDIPKYQRVGRQVRGLMLETTPMVEPLSIDEAFLDLSGTEKLHGASPAQTLVKLIRRIESEVGVTASIGLSYNKFLAKIASDLDKPRGLAVVGRKEAQDFLADKPVGIIWGVGSVLERKLIGDGIRKVADLRRLDESGLMRRYGAMGLRLHRFCRGEDDRRVIPDEPAKSISGETTFEHDIADPEELKRRLWPLCETVSRRLKKAAVGGYGVVLKLKTADFHQLTRSKQLEVPTQLADIIFRASVPLLEKEAIGAKFRLIGVGVGELVDAAQADPPDLLDSGLNQRARVERAIDEVRAKMGDKAIRRGRSLDLFGEEG